MDSNNGDEGESAGGLTRIGNYRGYPFNADERLRRDQSSPALPLFDECAVDRGQEEIKKR